jgi:hypothetical protein
VGALAYAIDFTSSDLPEHHASGMKSRSASDS